MLVPPAENMNSCNGSVDALIFSTQVSLGGYFSVLRGLHHNFVMFPCPQLLEYHPPLMSNLFVFKVSSVRFLGFKGKPA